ncbi:hypothetical protein BY458DRAFT_502382 [Sporodiniella umbellata]|nr:hypothetical protein BY458DRAFT_502382 [Sporodiniella umbellata]
MVHTFLILDGHQQAFSHTISQNDSLIKPEEQIPPYPLWSCMVQSSLEFCRIGWEFGNGSIGVLVTGNQPFLLNNLNQKDLRSLQQQFSNFQPREEHKSETLQNSIETSLNNFMNHSISSKQKRCRFVILSIAKNKHTQPFEFQNNENEPSKDFRSMLYKVAEKFPNLDHIQVDVLRLFLHSNQLPENVLNKEVSTKITLSVHNIPNGHNDLRRAMTSLARRWYNISILNISNIPMKSSEHTQSTTVSLYYKMNGHHLIHTDKSDTSTFIHDHSYSNPKQLNLVYLKRSRRTIEDSEWCTCKHVVSPGDFRDLPTEVYVDMTMRGSISYLMAQGASSESKWTHILMAEKNILYLYCLNNQLQSRFSALVEDSQELIEVKAEGQKKNKVTTENAIKTQQFIDTILNPNLHVDINSLMEATNKNPHYRSVSINPARYTYRFPITPSMVCATPISFQIATEPKRIKTEDRNDSIKPEESTPIVDTEVDQAWSQVRKYEDMTLREREDAAQGILLDTKPYVNVGTKINSSFRGRRNAPKQTLQHVVSKYPDPSLATPYLDAVPPTLDEKAIEEKEALERLGKPGSLLWLYWMNEKIRQREDHQEDIDMDIVLTYKKPKKEFEGRVAKPGEKGETT